MTSILTSIKKLLGITKEDTSFDEDIIVHINSTITILYQMGIGSGDFYISDDSSNWDDYISDPKEQELAKTYIYLKVKKIFDPPSSSTWSSAHDALISEFEWRLNSLADY